MMSSLTNNLIIGNTSLNFTELHPEKESNFISYSQKHIKSEYKRNPIHSLLATKAQHLGEMESLVTFLVRQETPFSFKYSTRSNKTRFSHILCIAVWNALNTSTKQTFPRCSSNFSTIPALIFLISTAEDEFDTNVYSEVIFSTYFSSVKVEELCDAPVFRFVR